MRRKLADYVGTVVRDTFKILDCYSKSSRKYFLVECLKCGNKKEMRCDAVFNEKVVSCGCYNKNNNYLKSIDITDMRSGKLVAIRDIGVNERNQHIWECRCDCGNLYNVEAGLFTQKRVRSCGCLIEPVLKENVKKALEACKEFRKDGTNYKVINSLNPPITNTSGEKLISIDRTGKYFVQITYKGKNHYLGRYDDMKTAIEVRNLAFEARRNGRLDEFIADKSSNK